jgi:eukaryotic-like serine/threonine-protein kinase
MGRYELRRELGRGGMGSVHLAYHVELGREVALKRLLPSSVGIPSAEAWFKREYRAMAEIRHPGVPTIFDCSTRGDPVAYFTMEIITGVSLAAYQRGRALAPDEALRIAIELGRILAAAHTAGVIHRDVKPQNIIIESGGHVRLIDFGICFLLPRFGARGHLRCVGEDEFHTAPHEVAGSLGYSDPALLDGAPPSAQSDVFSLCAVLYEMLLGRRLYDPKTGRCRSIDSGEFPPVLAPLAQELRRGCQASPADRHVDMDELVRSLEIARSAVLRAREASRSGRAGVAWRLPALACVLTGAALLLARDEGDGALERPLQVAATWGRVGPRAPSGTVTPERKSSVETAPGVRAVDAPAVPPRAEPPTGAERPGPVGKRPPRTTGADAAPTRELSQELVTRLAAPLGPALRGCVRTAEEVNLELVVVDTRAQLTRVEWVAYDPEDEAQRCLARALGRLEFPRAGRSGPYRLKVDRR